jgi:uncharacterized protein (DUF433 family)
MGHALTVTEVAALAGLDEGRVRKDVEHGLFGATSPPRFGFPAIVYFRTIAVLGVQLAVDDRKRLYALIGKALRGPKPATTIELSPVLEVKIGATTNEVRTTLEHFEAWQKKLVIDDEILGGEPVFPRSRLAVRQIGGMLLRGAKVEEVREDYPALKGEDIEFAKLYTVAYPRMGRPRVRKASAR